ncbi:MAG TPA: cell division protein FtsZ, partial [Candidatus Acetothermia bacterium]|nr:cell division protein FtsZ [Candidatus Acetothermia bacterium]
MVSGEERMSDKERSGDINNDSLRDQWREILSSLQDHILRACLPKDVQALSLFDNRLTISVDSEFKKEYCLRKQVKLEEAVADVMGPREVVIGEPPLVEQAKQDDQKPGTNARIIVLGVGDGGVNAVGRMKKEKLKGVRLVAVDTDKQVLGIAHTDETLQLAEDVTGGRGAGGDEEKGRKAALDSRWEISSLIKGMDLVFITAGFGGGTGTGAVPVIAKIAKESGALTIGVVTRPFTFEGSVRAERAERGLAELHESADVLIVISNDRLLETTAKGLAVTKAFEIADGILHQGVRGISDLVTVRGLVNLDFADINNVLSGAGEAMMGMGTANGEQRSVVAAKLATTNPLLEGGSIRGARRMIMNVTGGSDMTLGEVTAAADLIRRTAATECDLVFGAVVQEGFTDGIKITVIAADFGEPTEEDTERKK